jgi:hypothetical protein
MSGGDGMVFQKEEKQPSRAGEYPPQVAHNKHVPVAIKITHLKCV